MSDHLLSTYERLHAELEEAYAEKVWDTPKIDRIANAMTRVEMLIAKGIGYLPNALTSLAPHEGLA